MPGSTRRFERQVRFAPLGAAGQERLERGSVLLVGCGALGGVVAQLLVRSGVGRLAIVDRDVVDETNLARQVLFEERHARERALKVDAAREALARIGGPTRIETHAAHVGPENLGELARDADVLVDGTDNLATRYLVNDYCVERGRPWIYGGVVGGAGLVLAVLPGAGACLRCLFPDPPAPGALPTCETAGVLAPAVGAVAALQAGLAQRVLAGDPPKPRLLELDAWNGNVRSLAAERRADCPCCARREFPFLAAPRSRRALVLCGRNAVQVLAARGTPDVEALARAVAPVAKSVRRAGDMLRFEIDEHRVTLFADGRALVEGTEDEGRALALYDRYVGC